LRPYGKGYYRFRLLKSVTPLRMSGMNHLARAGADHAVTMLDVVQELVAEESDAAADGTGGGVAERTKTLSKHIIADVKQEVYVLLFAMPVFQALQ
jgi:hypothetical protein